MSPESGAARAADIETLRAAHDVYRNMLANVQALVKRNPRGLQVRPMFGQGPVRPVRKLRRAA